MQAEEERVNDVDQGVIDLEIGQVLDAAFAYRPGHRYGAGRRLPPWPSGLRARDDFSPSSNRPSVPKAGIMPCWKMTTSCGIEAEETMLLEERPRLRIVGIAGHDVPGNRLAVVAAVRL